ncbi:PO113 protein, partial [Smithornis capensis]|nr:PO113 protein [Smithornis capensis]
SQNAKATCRRWLEVFAVLGLPQQIKTDNGPNYVSKTVQEFLEAGKIKHVRGIPHNSTGQAIVERKHQD